MGAVKEKLIKDAEWLEEKLNQVSDTHYEFEACEDIIMFADNGNNVIGKTLANDLWKVAQLSPEDGNRLMDISEDLYIFAMEGHE